MRNVLGKSEIAHRYGITYRQLQRCLQGQQTRFPYWFTYKKCLTPKEYNPIFAYLEKELLFEPEKP
jgi:hypothetical protein